MAGLLFAGCCVGLLDWIGGRINEEAQKVPPTVATTAPATVAKKVTPAVATTAPPANGEDDRKPRPAGNPLPAPIKPTAPKKPAPVFDPAARAAFTAAGGRHGFMNPTFDTLLALNEGGSFQETPDLDHTAEGSLPAFEFHKPKPGALAKLPKVGHPFGLWVVEGDLNADDWRALGAQPGLTTLGFYQGTLPADGLAELAGAKSLTALNVRPSDNAIAAGAWAGLERLTGLTNLNIGGGHPEAVPHAAKLGNLRRLIVGSSKLTPADLRAIAGLSKLEVLSLEATQVTDDAVAELAPLRRLQKLSLSFTKLTDAGMVHVAGLKGLQVVALTETGVTGTGIRLLKALPALAMIDVTGRLASDEVIAGLGQAGLLHLWSKCNEYGFRFRERPKFSTDVRSVDLTFSVGTDAMLPELLGFVNLEELTLSGRPITDAGLAAVTKFKRLKTLNLAGTKITDAGLKHLDGMRSLTSVNLIRTGVTKSGADALQAKLGPKCSIDR